MPRRDDTDGLLGLDPAVAASIAGGMQRQASRSGPVKSRKERQRQRQRNRMTIDLSVDLDAHLVGMAQQLSVPVSSLVVYLVEDALEHVNMDDLMNVRKATRSMRYEFVLSFNKGDTKGRHQG